MTAYIDSRYPPELLLAICAYIHSSCIPSPLPSLDPLVTEDYGVPTSLPSSMPAASWPEPVARRTLAQLCLVSRAWYDAAKPWLWDKLEVRLPRTFLSMVEEIAWDYDEETVDMVMDNTIRAATTAAALATGSAAMSDAAKALEERILFCLGAPDESIPLELLSPVASREPSPRRLRPKSKSPARWKIMRSISDAVQTLLDRDLGVYSMYILHLLGFRKLMKNKFPLQMTLAPADSCATWISTTSGRWACAARSRRASIAPSSRPIASRPSSRFVAS